MQRIAVVNCIIVDARRGLAGYNDFRRRLHHALIDFLHLVEGRRGCGEIIVCRSIELCGIAWRFFE